MTLRGFSSDEEMAQHVTRVAAEVRRLKPGFLMISDISQMKSATPNGTKMLQDIMLHYKKHGIAKIIRIVGDDVIAKGQFNRLAKDAGIPVHYVSTREEAEKLATAREESEHRKRQPRHLASADPETGWRSPLR
jgi:hypothetical protein